MLKISECSENCNTCCVFKISAHVENCNACSKLCWIFQGVLKTCWKFQGMLKTIICVENYVETACWKFQHVLKTVMHVESYVKISSVLKMFMLGMLKPYWKPCWSTKKAASYFTAHAEIELQISFFSFGFARVTEVRHIYVGIFIQIVFKKLNERKLKNSVLAFNVSLREFQFLTSAAS